MIERLLLCTDLDRTLLPNGDEPEAEGARDRFIRISRRPEVSLAYVTGRHLDLTLEACREFAVPEPDFLVADVGTEIFEREASGWRPWQAWRRSLASQWDDTTHAHLRRWLEDRPELKLQEGSRQGRFKLSYYAPGQRGDWLDEVAEIVEDRAKVIYSVDEDGTGLLDVLPAVAGKLAALRFLRLRLRLELDDILFAGDSGNDLEVLASEVPSVLVANAAPDVRQSALSLAGATSRSDQLYIAHNEAGESDGNYSAGILQGLFHFRPETRAWLEE